MTTTQIWLTKQIIINNKYQVKLTITKKHVAIVTALCLTCNKRRRVRYIGVFVGYWINCYECGHSENVGFPASISRKDI